MSIFQSWLCVEYQFDGRDLSKIAIGHKYMRQDLHIRCSDDDFTASEYVSVTSLALVLVFVW